MGKAVTHLKIDVGYLKPEQDEKVFKNPFPQLKRLSQLSLLVYYPSLSDLYLDFSRTAVVFDGIEALQHLPLRRLCLKMAGAWELLIHPETRIVQPLQSLFPYLDTLFLKDTRGVKASTCTHAEWEQLARQLPRSLTHLELGIIDSILPLNFGSLLPPFVSKLLLESRNGFTDNSARISDTVTSFTLERVSLLTIGECAILPASLTYLSLSRPVSDKTSRYWYHSPPELISSLPQTLKTLHAELPSFESDIFSFLPRNLTELDIPRLEVIQVEHVKHLPRCLEILKVMGSRTSAEAFADLPRSLTVLRCSFAISSDDHWSKLPPLLKELDHVFGGTTPQVPPKGRFLPKQLETLSFSTNTVAFSSLPETLTSLTVTNEKFEFTDVETAPAGLTSLSLAAVPESFQRFVWFPKRLEYLRINNTENFLPRMLEELPKTLRSLYLGPGCDTISMSQLLVLPEHMDHLYVYTINIDPSVLKTHFATSLESLSVDSLVSLSESLLPSQLTSRICHHWNIPGEYYHEFFRELQTLPHLVDLDWTLSTRHHPTFQGGRYPDRSYWETVQRSFFAGSSATTFKKLRKLRCNISPHLSSVLDSTITERLSAIALDHLPHNLTELECNFPVKLCLLAKLHQLVSLNLPRFLPTLEFYDTLPSTLTSLQIRSETLMIEVWPKLPRALSTLTIGSLQFFRSSQKELPPFNQLPPLITELTFCSGSELKFTGPCTSWLRPDFGQISIGTGTQSLFDYWTASNLSKGGTLPESVINVYLSQIPPGAQADLFSRFPSTVTRISMPNNYHFTTDSISQWPASLTSIHLGGLLFSKKDLEGIDPAQSALDWSLLKSLILSRGPKGLIEVVVDNHCEFSSPDWVDALPDQLKVIDLASCQISDSSIARLPRSLEALRLSTARRLTSQCLKAMPPSLTELVLMNLDMKPCTFPSTLTRLELRGCPSFTSQHIETLPSTLIQLILPGSTLIDSCLHKSLPHLRCLELRQIRLSTTSLNGKALLSLPSIVSDLIDALPTSLESLKFNELIFDPEAILSELPPSITHVELPSPNVKTIKSTISSDDDPDTVYRRSVNRIIRPLQSGSIVNPNVSLAPSLHPPRGTYSNPASSKPQATQSENWMEFEVRIAPQHTRLFLGENTPNSLARSGKSIPVVWILPSNYLSPTKTFPPNLKTFHCDHLTNWEHSTIQNLPEGLLSLKLQHSRRIQTDTLTLLPKSLTSLQVNPANINYLPRLDYTWHAPRPFPIDYKILPPNLTRLILSGVEYIGSNASKLRHHHIY
jgi:hypothetical protein